MKDDQPFEHINLSYLKRISDKQADVMQNYILTFLKEVPSHIDKLNAFEEENNWEQFRNTVHALKALMNFMGAEKAEVKLNAIRECVKSNEKAEKLNKLKKKFLREFEQVCAELKSVN